MWRVVIFISLTALMSLVASSQGTQTDRAAAPIVIARPVKRLPVQAPASADIEFDEFEFKLLAGSRHPGTWPIEGEPSKGYTYFVEARVYGLEAIATARFEVLDEQGALIEPARIRRETGAGGSSGFYGLMTVPNRPFRVALTGEAIDGQRYQRVYQRLFKPIDKPVVHPILKQAASRADKRKLSRMLEDLIKQESTAIDEELKKSGGWIVIPRTRVSNVNYQPLLSPAGRPRGVRITYDLEFSETGYYNPQLHVFPFYADEEWRGRIGMKVFDSSISPQPEEVGSQEASSNPLADHTGFIYLGRTTYHVTADFFPEYVIRNEAKTKFCLWNQQHSDSPPDARAIYQAILLSKEPATYRVWIMNSDFTGEIENFYGQGVFYSTFAAEGARDCGPQPTTRF